MDTLYTFKKGIAFMLASNYLHVSFYDLFYIVQPLILSNSSLELTSSLVKKGNTRVNLTLVTLIGEWVSSSPCPLNTIEHFLGYLDWRKGFFEPRSLKHS